MDGPIGLWVSDEPFLGHEHFTGSLLQGKIVWHS